MFASRTIAYIHIKEKRSDIKSHVYNKRFSSLENLFQMAQFFHNMHALHTTYEFISAISHYDRHSNRTIYASYWRTFGAAFASKKYAMVKCWPLYYWYRWRQSFHNWIVSCIFSFSINYGDHTWHLIGKGWSIKGIAKIRNYWIRN